MEMASTCDHEHSGRAGARLQKHVKVLRACTQCPRMIGPVVTGAPVASPVMLLGQAPGTHEGRFGRPFAWTAGKTLFKWLARCGMEEERFRSRAYMAAVCRCFPGKNPKGGDRVPDPEEIERCASWLREEVRILRPRLLLPVGKLAISQVIGLNKLSEVIGKVHRVSLHDHVMDAIPLPHPSGASTWHRTEPGKGLLDEALALIANHEAFVSLLDQDSAPRRNRRRS